MRAKRMADDDLGDAREEIEALLATLESAAPRILESLDRSIAEAEEATRALRERRDS